MTPAGQQSVLRRLGRAVARRYHLALAAATVALKLPVLTVPCSGDATSYLLPTVYWILEEGPSWFLEGGDTRGTNGFGHPPFFFHVLAAAMRLAGPSLTVARLTVAAFAALGVYCTARFAHSLYGRTGGFIAASLLLLNPIYFAQAGLVRLSIPLSALGAATALAALRGNRLAYVAAGSALVLAKEPGVCLMGAILPVVWLRNRGLSLRRRVRELLPYCIPVLLFVVWILLNELRWGKMVNRPGIKWAAMHPWWRTKELLFSGGQWTLTLPVLAWLLWHGRHKAKGWRLACAAAATCAVFLLLSLPPVGLSYDAPAKLGAALLVGSLCLQPLSALSPGTMLAGLALAVTMGPLFALNEKLPRYLLPALPFYCILAAGALRNLFRRWALLWWGVCVVALIVGWRGPRSAGGDMAYVHLVGTVHDAVAYVESAYPDDAVIVSCFSERAMRDPRMGYVRRPLRAYAVEEVGGRVDPGEVGAFLFVFSPGRFDALEVQNRRLQRDLNLLRRKLGRPLSLEREFRSRSSKAVVFRPE